jgi:uncharacterized membrane protein
VSTLRADFLGSFDRIEPMAKPEVEQVIVKPLPLAELPRVIETPAALASLTIESELSKALLADATSRDSIPSQVRRTRLIVVSAMAVLLALFAFATLKSNEATKQANEAAEHARTAPRRRQTPPQSDTLHVRSSRRSTAASADLA